MTHTLYIRRVPKTFQERWLSWPWQPWINYVEVEIKKWEEEKFVEPEESTYAKTVMGKLPHQKSGT